MTKAQAKRIAQLEKLFKKYPWEYELATMSPSERRFYDPDAKRGN